MRKSSPPRKKASVGGRQVLFFYLSGPDNTGRIRKNIEESLEAAGVEATFVVLPYGVSNMEVYHEQR